MKTIKINGWYEKNSPCSNATEKDTWSLVFMDFRPTNPYKIHVWYIYLHLVDIYGFHVGQCIPVPWIRHGYTGIRHQPPPAAPRGFFRSKFLLRDARLEVASPSRSCQRLEAVHNSSPSPKNIRRYNPRKINESNLKMMVWKMTFL